MKVKIEFKKIQEMDGHEGLAYRADLYVNGKVEGEISDDGNGGMYMFHSYKGNYAIEKALNALSKTDEFNNKRIYPGEKDPSLIKYNDLSEFYFHYGDVKFLKKYFKKTVTKVAKANNLENIDDVGLVILSYEKGCQSWLESFAYRTNSETSLERAESRAEARRAELLNSGIKTNVFVFSNLKAIDDLLCFELKEVE